MEPCNFREHYLVGVIGGLLVGWIFGQFWQSFQDRNFMKIMTRFSQNCLSTFKIADIRSVSLKNLQEDLQGDLQGECNQMFDDSCRTTEQIRDIGRNKGDEPVLFHISKGGGYATNRDLEEVSEKSKKFRRISRADELEIMHTFEDIVGMSFYRALGVVEEQGYALHPVYINGGPKNPAGAYSGTLLGVKVNDSEYDPTENKLSKRATIVEIVDVGGQDPHNRGVVHL